ncbi:hypothetical protein Hanom_Chr12g01160081 [Helianthus anomalus]
MKVKVWSSHSFVDVSSGLLIPSLPVTSSSKTFPKQYTSYAQLGGGGPVCSKI